MINWNQLCDSSSETNEIIECKVKNDTKLDIYGITMNEYNYAASTDFISYHPTIEPWTLAIEWIPTYIGYNGDL